jgi:NAD(P)-dependent dehydrogenase (short-subunit alcohol dehydrogenase family)
MENQVVLITGALTGIGRAALTLMAVTAPSKKR